MTREDLPAFLDLIYALADYEHLPRPDEAARARLASDAFTEPPRYEALVAELWGEGVPAELVVGEATGAAGPAALAGYAVYFVTYSTFQAKPSLYLEDLFVRPEHRGRGAGRALFERCAALAVARGCGRMEWVVLDWNTPSIEFYERRGARHLNEWRAYRLDGAALEAVGAGGRG